jgi:hypothetical protein
MITTAVRKHPDGYIRAKYGEHRIGDQAPYWSVTAEISSRLKFTDRAFIAGGCLHDDVRVYFPELVHTLRWHLSSSGVPLHYLENARYWHGKAHGRVDCRAYDPDPAATFTEHVVPLEGEDPAIWLAMDWGDLRPLLVAREPALRAAYTADIAAINHVALQRGIG